MVPAGQNSSARAYSPVTKQCFGDAPCWEKLLHTLFQQCEPDTVLARPQVAHRTLVEAACHLVRRAALEAERLQACRPEVAHKKSAHQQ